MRISTKNLCHLDDPTDGLLYLLELELEDKVLVKIGVTQRIRIEDRVCEILVSIWKRYRVFPKCVTKRYRSVKDVYAKEKFLHKTFSSDRYATKFVFSGSTELFTTPVEEVIKTYEAIID